MRVFVDTSALLALLNTADRAHERVVAALERLEAAAAALVTSNYVLLEAEALARRRLGPACSAALRSMVAEDLDEVIWVGEELHHEAWSAALTDGRRGPSIVDRVGFLLVERLALDAALAVDADFRGRGFDVLP